MGETTQTQTGASPVTGQSSNATGGSTSQQTPETYTRDQMQKLLSDALAEQGRKHKAELTPILSERDNLKLQLQGKTGELEDIKAERDQVRKDIDDLSSGDPKKFDLLARDRALRERERKVKDDLLALEGEKQKHGERIKKAEAFEREVFMQGLIEDYEGADFDRLKDLCETLGATSEDQIRKAADILWTKKNPANPNPSPKPYSGMTTGGTTFTRDPKNPSKTLNEAFNKLKK